MTKCKANNKCNNSNNHVTKKFRCFKNFKVDDFVNDLKESNWTVDDTQLTSVAYNINRLQKLKNMAMRIILGAPFKAHINDMLRTLSFMSVRDRITFATARMMYKVNNNIAPFYTSTDNSSKLILSNCPLSMYQKQWRWQTLYS